MRLTLFRLGRLQPLGIPIPAYLIQTTDGTNVLVDSGFPRTYIDEPPGPQGPLGLQPHFGPDEHVGACLESMGLRPADIDIVVCSHFDADHAGNHHLFEAAELVVQRTHYEAAMAGLERLSVVRDSWGAPHLRYRLVDGDVTLLPGVELIETSGHVPGHQSVLVRLPRAGPVLLAVDAVPTAAAMDAEARTIYPNDEDEAETRASTRKLADLVAREGVVLVIHGHDPEQWASLRLAPEFYD